MPTRRSLRVRSGFIVLLLTALAGRTEFSAQPAGTPGIARTTTFENARASVIRVRLAPGAREVVHTHPNDILIIQDTPGEAELMIAGAASKGWRDHGSVAYVTANAPHWAANTGAQSFDLLVVHMK